MIKYKIQLQTLFIELIYRKGIIKQTLSFRKLYYYKKILKKKI